MTIKQEDIIPSSTGAARAVGVVIPELSNAATMAEICAEMKAQSEAAMKGVLGYTSDKVVAWYDNEWGYSNKCLDMACMAADYKGV